MNPLRQTQQPCSIAQDPLASLLRRRAGGRDRLAESAPEPTAAPAAPDHLAGALLDAVARLETGIVIVDRRVRILFASAPARRLLLARGLLSPHDGTLRAGSAASSAELRRLVAEPPGAPASEPRHRSILIGSDGDEPVLARLVPLARDPHGPGPHDPDAGDRAPAALILLTQRRAALPSLHDLQLRFGLTPAEAGCAREMLRCDGLGAYARRAGITLATARTHLKHVFEKTGTRRQAQLVRRVLAEVPCSLASEDDAL